MDAAALRVRPLLLLAILIAGTVPAQEGPSPLELDRAVQAGILWLLEAQELDGHWGGRGFHKDPGGATALALYTLLKAGLEPDHPAVRAGQAAMDAAFRRTGFAEDRPGARTYTAAVMLMAQAALGSARTQGAVEELAEFLLRAAQGSRWSYPVGRPDLSNTQYALLGLRAAEQAGVRIPASLWMRAARSLLQVQESYGGWSYRIGGRPTASMTCAGLTGLLVCREALARRSRARVLGGGLRAGLRNGRMWLSTNWSVEENSDPERPDKRYDRWLYYYLYGLERVGSLSGEETVGEHAWYPEGAAFLLEEQHRSGRWHAPGYPSEDDVNTCFALLFLVRGTRESGPVERPPDELHEESRAAVVIRGDHGNPMAAWVRTMRPEAAEALPAGFKGVVWKVDGREVGLVPPPEDGDPLAAPYTLKHRFEENGRHEVQAFLRLAGGRELPSNVLRKVVHDVQEPWQAEAVADAGRNLVDPETVQVTASSSYSGRWSADRAADGTYTTSWLSAEDDEDPVLTIRPRAPVKVAEIAFACALPYGRPDRARRFARPREVEVVLDGTHTLRLECGDQVDRKHRIVLEPRVVSAVTLRIRSVHPGRRHPRAVGLRELELLGPPR